MASHSHFKQFGSTLAMCMCVAISSQKKKRITRIVINVLKSIQRRPFTQKLLHKIRPKTLNSSSIKRRWIEMNVIIKQPWHPTTVRSLTAVRLLCIFLVDIFQVFDSGMPSAWSRSSNALLLLIIINFAGNPTTTKRAYSSEAFGTSCT